MTIRDLEQRIEDLRADYRRELDGLRGDLLYGLRMVETRAGYLEQQAAALERAVYSEDEAIAALERRLSERSPVRFTQQRSMLLVA